MLQNPAPAVTMEFQGGESLLRFDLVKEGVLYSKEQNKNIGKQIEYVISYKPDITDRRIFSFLRRTRRADQLP